MIRSRRLLFAAALGATFAALTAGQHALEARARSHDVTAPRFEVDPLWPKPLPHHWVLGNVIGVGVDANDHVFIVHRNDTFDAPTEIGAVQNPKLSDCCVPAPPVLEFDPAGNLVNAWGGPNKDYDWPASNHGISIDNKDNGDTLLTGLIVDQALLHGLLRKIRDLGMPLLSVTRLQTPKEEEK